MVTLGKENNDGWWDKIYSSGNRSFSSCKSISFPFFHLINMATDNPIENYLQDKITYTETRAYKSKRTVEAIAGQFDLRMCAVGDSCKTLCKFNS